MRQIKWSMSVSGEGDMQAICGFVLDSFLGRMRSERYGDRLPFTGQQHRVRSEVACKNKCFCV